MANREEPPYDPYIPSGGAAGQQGGQNGNHRTAALQAVRRHLPHACCEKNKAMQPRLPASLSRTPTRWRR